MSRTPAQKEVLDQMTDGLITLEEGRERFEKAGGVFADFKAFANENRNEIFHGDPISAETWPWPKEYGPAPEKAAPKRWRR
jgi:hypothetical protein